MTKRHYSLRALKYRCLFTLNLVCFATFLAHVRVSERWWRILSRLQQLELFILSNHLYISHAFRNSNLAFLWNYEPSIRQSYYHDYKFWPIGNFISDSTLVYCRREFGKDIEAGCQMHAKKRNNHIFSTNFLFHFYNITKDLFRTLSGGWL